MDAEAWKTIGTYVGALISAPFVKIWIESIALSHEKLRAEYDFAKKVLDDLKANPDMTMFQRALGLRALAGTRNIRPQVVEYLIHCEDPDALKTYVACAAFIEENPDVQEQQRITFRKAYKSPIKRWLSKASRFGLYIVAGLTAFAPMWLAPLVGHKPEMWRLAVTQLATAALFLPVAVRALDSSTKLHRAEKLVANQKRFEPPVRSEPRRLTRSSLRA